MEFEKRLKPEEERVSPRALLIESLTWVKGHTKLEVVGDASLETGVLLEKQGKWAEASSVYFSVSEKSKESLEKAGALISLSQMLINLGELGRARRFLNKLGNELPSLDCSPEDKRYFTARIFEKKAWIADYEGEFEEEERNLTKVIRLVDIPRNRDEEDLLSTATHFLGRAYFGQAVTARDGSVRKEKLEMATDHFTRDLKRFERMRESGDPQPANEGFQCAWMARCLIAQGDLELAGTFVKLAMENFTEYEGEHAGSGIMAHGLVLDGGLKLAQGNIRDARESFEKALEIRYRKERYPKGEADALLGVAATYWAEKNFGAAFSYALRAVKVYPLVIFRGVI